MGVPIKVFGIMVMMPGQKESAQQHCFDDCGKISMAGAIADELTGGLFVCCEAVCPHCEQDMDEPYGTTMSFGQEHAVYLRKLKPASQSAKAGNG